MSKYYILDGHRAVVEPNQNVWAEWFGKHDRRVARTEIGNAVVSTVFLSLDHSYGDGPPMLFESLIMGGPMDQEMRRYSTWEEAERGHADLVQCATFAVPFLDASLIPSAEVPD